MPLNQIRTNAEQAFPHENARIKALVDLVGSTEPSNLGDTAFADRNALLATMDGVLKIHAAETSEGRTYCIECIGIDGVMENYPCRTAAAILGTPAGDTPITTVAEEIDLDPVVEAAAKAMAPVAWTYDRPSSSVRRATLRQVATDALAAAFEVMLSQAAIDQAVRDHADLNGISNIFHKAELALAYRTDVLTILTSITGVDLIAKEIHNDQTFASWMNQ